MQISVAGRSALVTGASRGIGRAIALRLAGAGADVAVNYRRDKEAADAVVAEITAMGRRAKAYGASVEFGADIEALAGDVARDFPNLSILVNNAGIASRGSIAAETDPAECERLLRVHALGPHHLTKLLTPILRAQGRGDIVMISSVATMRMGANGAPYNMAKAAMEALALTLAKEERRYGVRTHIVAPTLTETDMGVRLNKARSGAADMRELDAHAPFGRVSVPDDVANVVAFLVSDANPYVNGQKINVDGGG